MGIQAQKKSVKRNALIDRVGDPRSSKVIVLKHVETYGFVVTDKPTWETLLGY